MSPLRLFILASAFLALSCSVHAAIPVASNFASSVTITDLTGAVQHVGYIVKLTAPGNKWKLGGFLNATFSATTSAHISGRVETLYDSNDVYSTMTTSTGMALITCLPRDSYPPFGELQAAFASGVLLTDSQKSLTPARCRACAGRLYSLTFAGQQYAVCQKAAPSNDIVTVYGELFTIAFSNFVTLNPIEAAAALALLNLPAELKVNVWWGCNNTSPYTAHHNVPTPISNWLGGVGVLAGRSDVPAVGSSAANQQPRAASLPTCYFLHGTGVNATSATTSTYPDYWGKVENFTPQCGARFFIHEETVSRGWNDTALQQSYCNLVAQGQANPLAVANVLVFTHSMGNLILAAAINNSFCDFNLTSSRWFEVQGPILGSKASARLVEFCGSESPQRELFKALNYCNSTTYQPAGSYATLVPGTPGLTTIQSVMSARISASLCGTSPVGIASQYSVELLAVAVLADYGEPNDGLVPYSSCTASSSTASYSGNYTAPYYKSAVNHADGTCREGNGLWGVDRQPCSWYPSRLL